MPIDNEKLCTVLNEELEQFSLTKRELPTLKDETKKGVLVKQLIDSVRRVEYARVVGTRSANQLIADPKNEVFNPIKAVVYHLNNGNTDEATWLVFLVTHFGYSASCKWLLVKDVYGKLGDSSYWTWDSVTKDTEEFCLWSESLREKVRTLVPKRKFGNHRKYESLKTGSNRSLSKVVTSYVNLISSAGGSHEQLFANANQAGEGCKYKAFEYLYDQTNEIVSFGRTAKFDFLTMLGKLGIVEIEPPKTYMQGSTGPIKGARLLFGDKKMRVSELEKELFELQKSLSINPFGMQVLEDALCNWQKSPKNYIYFKG